MRFNVQLCFSWKLFGRANNKGRKARHLFRKSSSTRVFNYLLPLLAWLPYFLSYVRNKYLMPHATLHNFSSVMFSASHSENSTRKKSIPFVDILWPRCVIFSSASKQSRNVRRRIWRMRNFEAGMPYAHHIYHYLDEMHSGHAFTKVMVSPLIAS